MIVDRFVAVLLCAALFIAPASRIQGLGEDRDITSNNHLEGPHRKTGCMKVITLHAPLFPIRYINLDICDQGLYLYFAEPGNTPYLYGPGALPKWKILGPGKFENTDMVRLSYTCEPKLLELSVDKCDPFFYPIHTMHPPSGVLPAPVNPALVPPRSRIAAIFLDYDGCGDIISPSNPLIANDGEFYNQYFKGRGFNYHQVAGYLLHALEKIGEGRDKVILFVGSERQDRNHDKMNRKHNGNGLALGTGGGFELLAAMYKDRGWELNNALLADGGVLGSAWNDDTKTYNWEKSEVVKKEVAENNFEQLQNLGPVDVFFIDDVKTYTDFVRHHAKVPQNINFYTIHYDWYAYAMQGMTRELVAKDVYGRLQFLNL